ncbi:MAG: alpha-amylase [Anaerolineae bacterium]|nr:alpha-amylase [Anaerolineae bacterium]
MEEFIFGTLATDPLKLIHYRAARRGLHHQHELHPRDPLPGEPITITVSVGPNLDAEQVVCYYTTDGSQPAGSKGVAHHGQAAQLQLESVEWDTLAWGYLQRWTGVLPPQPENTIIRYQIGAWSGDAPEVFADWPLVKAASEHAAAAYFRGEPIPDDLHIGDPHQPHTFTCPVDRFAPPAWAHDAVIYHIFVDRFFPGQGRDWLQTDDLNGFCGGTLWGVAEKLDYIQELGANCIWLSPIFVSSTHHGYDVTDYDHVEPRLGGDEALRHLIEAAHGRGLRVILDIALNHLSDQHPYFQSALNKENSPYRGWFTFDDSDVGYRSFFGVATMPQLNVNNLDARRWLLDVGRYWIREFGIDGYRLDVADGPGPDFWTDFWHACKGENADLFCFGEVVDAPDIQRHYVGRLDGLLNFHVCDMLRRTFAAQEWTEAEFERFLERHTRYFPAGFLMPTFIDNHDMDRFLFAAGGDKAALRRAAQVQMRLPHPPVIYYGTEVGITQAKSSREGLGLHINRVPMLWDDEQDHELLAFYRALIQERKAAR